MIIKTRTHQTRKTHKPEFRVNSDCWKDAAWNQIFDLDKLSIMDLRVFTYAQLAWVVHKCVIFLHGSEMHQKS